MAKIIMYGNQKGGVGKSLCSIATATTLSCAPFNLKVSLIDIDPQKSIVAARKFDADYYSAPAPFDVLEYSIKDMQGHIKQMDADNHIIIIDAAGKLDSDKSVSQQDISKALMYVDFLFLPFVAGSYNLESTLRYLKYAIELQKARTTARKLHVTGFVNLYRSRSRVNKQLLQDIERIKKVTAVPFMQTHLHDYTLFKEIDTYKSIYDPDTYDTAKINFLCWINEICKICNIKKYGKEKGKAIKGG